MTVISEKDRQTILDLLEKELVDGVDLLFFTRPRSRIFVPGYQDCVTCDETHELLRDLVSLHDKLTLNVHDVSADPDVARRYNVGRVPTVQLRRTIANPEDTATDEHDQQENSANDEVPGVRFVGQPSGYEFSTLLADIVDISKGQTDLSEQTREAVLAIDQPVHIQVFVTPT